MEPAKPDQKFEIAYLGKDNVILCDVLTKMVLSQSRTVRIAFIENNRILHYFVQFS